jgi:hypothetical protein
VHLAVGLDLRLADDRDVVLGDARHDARHAAGAGVHVDRHAPLLAAIFMIRVQGDALAFLVVLHLLDEGWILLELLERRRANQVAAFDRPMFLGHRQVVMGVLRQVVLGGEEPGGIGAAER